MKVDNIYELLEQVSKLNVSSFEYEEDGSKLSIKFNEPNQVANNISREVAVSTYALPEERKEEETSGEVITSPIVGTFYSSGTEGGEPFVKVGDSVAKGDVVAIIEAMKLMNEIQSEYEGVVKKVLVKNGQVVEYGQPLFEIG